MAMEVFISYKPYEITVKCPKSMPCFTVLKTPSGPSWSLYRADSVTWALSLTSLH